MMQPQSDAGLLAADDPYLTLESARRLYVQGDSAHDFDHVLRVARMAVKIAQAEDADVQIVRLAALLHDVPAQPADSSARPDTETDTETVQPIPEENTGGTKRAGDSSASVGHTVGASVDASVGDDSHAAGADYAAARLTHHHAAAAFAREWLTVQGLESAACDNVVHCIQAHRFRDQSIQPATLEAKCLYDADKLDSIGAIGVVRAFAYAGQAGARMWTEPWGAVPPAEHKPEGEHYTPVHEYVYKLKRILPTLHTITARRIAEGRHATMVAFFDQLDAEMQGLA